MRLWAAGLVELYLAHDGCRADFPKFVITVAEEFPVSFVLFDKSKIGIKDSDGLGGPQEDLSIKLQPLLHLLPFCDVRADAVQPYDRAVRIPNRARAVMDPSDSSIRPHNPELLVNRTCPNQLAHGCLDALPVVRMDGFQPKIRVFIELVDLAPVDSFRCGIQIKKAVVFR